MIWTKLKPTKMFLLKFVFSVYAIFWPFALFYVKDRAERNGLHRQQPLPDLMHDILPHISFGWTQLTDFMSYSSSWSVLLWSILGQVSWRDKYILYMTCLQALRCLCFNATILPDTRRQDEAKPLWRRLLFGGQFDLCFSGHIMYLYAPWWFLFSLHLISTTTLFIARVLTGLAALIILASRAHYTIDVFVAVISSHWMYDVLFSK